MEPQKASDSQRILKKKNKSGSITILYFKLCYKTAEIKTVIGIKREHNRKPRNEPTIIWSINLRQSRNKYSMEKSLFNKWCWENWTTFLHHTQNLTPNGLKM